MSGDVPQSKSQLAKPSKKITATKRRKNSAGCWRKTLKPMIGIFPRRLQPIRKMRILQKNFPGNFFKAAPQAV